MKAVRRTELRKRIYESFRYQHPTNLDDLLKATKKTETRKVNKQCNKRLRHENLVIKVCYNFELGYAST
jgi:hypothetical protein